MNETGHCNQALHKLAKSLLVPSVYSGLVTSCTSCIMHGHEAIQT